LCLFWFLYGGDRDLDALKGEEFCALGEITLNGAWFGIEFCNVLKAGGLLPLADPSRSLEPPLLFREPVLFLLPEVLFLEPDLFLKGWLSPLFLDWFEDLRTS
jgi:hypothetical protein